MIVHARGGENQIDSFAEAFFELFLKLALLNQSGDVALVAKDVNIAFTVCLASSLAAEKIDLPDLMFPEDFL